jgi:CRISPR-associated protein Cas1
MVLARTFVEGAVGNILANLRYRAYRGGEDVLKATISEIEGRFAAIAAAEDVTALMGVEGRRR